MTITKYLRKGLALPEAVLSRTAPLFRRSVLSLSCGALLVFAGNASAQGTLISGLQSQDIGTEGNYVLMGMGSTEELAPGDYDMVAGGWDIWGDDDGFQFAYEQMDTRFVDLRVQVPFVEDGVDQWTKAGIMIRGDLTPGSAHAMNIVTPQEGQNAWVPQYRPEADSGSSRWAPDFQVEGLEYPDVWVRLTRIHNVFTSYYSTDGEEWTEMVQVTVDLPANAYAGLVLTSHNNSDNPEEGLAQAEFRNYQTVPVDPALMVPLVDITETGQSISFDAEAFAPGAEIDPDSIRVTINGVDRTDEVTVTGSGTAISGSINGLDADRFYVLEVEAPDSNGAVGSASATFNTLNPEGQFTWEANDWNFGGGQYFDNPGIDFTDPDNYFDRLGTDGIDENTNEDAGRSTDYRINSEVGTSPADDEPREPWASHTGMDAIQYRVGWVSQGEWLNYTRTFPAGEYFVYARYARDGGDAWAVELSRVTSDPTQPDQTTEALGTFSKDTGTGGWSNWEFIPLVDENGNPAVVEFSGSPETLRATDIQTGVDKNYYMLVPANVDLPRVTNLSLSSGETVDARDGISFRIESAAGVAREDITLSLNGEDRTGSFTITGDENDWAVSYNALDGGTSYQLEVHAVDADGNSQLLFTGQPLQVSFDTAVSIPAHLATPPGSGSDPGFTVRVHNARDDAPGLGNSIVRAEDQLAGNLIDSETGEPFENLAIGEPGDQGNATFIETGTINYDQDAGNVGDWETRAFPGIPAGDPNWFAIEITAYLELSAGTHRFGFRHDDGFRLAVGPSFESDDLELAMIQDWDQGGPSQAFEFIVEESGVYAARLVMYEGSGGANLVWYSIDDNGDEILVNDTSDARAIRAFQNREGEPSVPEPEDGVPAPSIVWDGSNHVISWEGTGFTLESADEITGPWTPVDAAGNSYEESGEAEKRFYRLRAE